MILMLSLFRSSLALALAALLVCPPVLAFDAALSEEAVREAYFLGQRNDNKMTQALDPYAKRLALPERGPYISEIKLFTPYAQIIDFSRQQAGHYSAQQAQQDYRDRGDTVLVFVRIEFTATYSYPQAVASADRIAKEQGTSLQPQDFWKDFRLGLSQDARWIEPLSQRAEALYNRGEGGLGGAVVWLEFDARDVASTEASVEVETPDGQHIVASFDLSRLR
jgi:hypothetical protein